MWNGMEFIIKLINLLFFSLFLSHFRYLFHSYHGIFIRHAFYLNRWMENPFQL